MQFLKGMHVNLFLLRLMSPKGPRAVICGKRSSNYLKG